MNKSLLSVLMLLSVCQMALCQTDSVVVVSATDSIQSQPKKEGFFKKILKPFKWIGRNWSDYDPSYSTPCLYNWVVQAQNTSSKEWLNMSTEDGMEVKMRSKTSNKIGPYLGYSFLMYGYTVDLNALKGTKRRNEFTLSINCNLFNIDLIRRRTGGDFIPVKLQSAPKNPETGKVQTVTDMTSMAKMYDIGDLMDYDVTGININYFTNHRKFSNPAGYTNGAIQLRSAGTWIFGLGYERQKISSDVSDAIVNYGFHQIKSQIPTDKMQTLLDQLNKDNPNQNFKDFEEYAVYLTHLYDDDIEAYKSNLNKIYKNSYLRPLIFGDRVFDDYGYLSEVKGGILNVLFNEMPSVVTIDDWNLHIGYAYNLALSPRWLFAITGIISPGIKRVSYDNNWSVAGATAEELAQNMNEYYFGNTDMEGIIETGDFLINNKVTRFGINYFGRAALTFTKNRWRAGFNINANAFILKSDIMKVWNVYGSAVLYVGYCFGLKKDYRKGNKMRDMYDRVR